MRRYVLLAIILAIFGAGAVYRYGGLALFGAGSRTAGTTSQDAGSSRGGGAPVAVVIAPVEQVTFPVRRRSFGYAEPMASVIVRSRVDSQLLDQHFTEGQFVKKGDLLFTLDDRELKAQVAKDEATLAKDRALRARTQNDLQRAQQLLQRNAGTQQALDQATADAKSADATILGDEAALDTDRVRLSYARINADIAGRVGSVSITPGNLVHANDTGPGLVTITQIAPIRVSFTVPERDFPSVQQSAAKAPIEVRVFERGSPDKPITGKLTFIDSQVDTTTGTVILKAEFANADLGLWPGEYVDVELDTAQHPNAAVVPTVAVQQGQDFSYVFVARADNTAELRKVIPGGADATRTEVVSGLKPGESVVVDGQLRLSNGARLLPQTLQSRRETGKDPV